MTQEIEEHVASVEAFYRPLISRAGSRLSGGERLWAQFEQAVTAFRKHGRSQVSGIIERVNELAVARELMLDATLELGPIEYEPEIVVGGPKFDFAATDVAGRPLYIEVKTVEPRTADSDENWQKAERRLANLSPHNHYMVQKEWMGAAIFGNSFSARSSFWNYTLETEAKLGTHRAIKPGRGVLIFCGNGFTWHMSELEDFADFYAFGRHRADDPFGAMEQHSIDLSGNALAGTLDAFGGLVRPHEAIEASKFVHRVRGPTLD